MEPLASKIRPTSLDEFVGQEHLVGPGKPLREAIEGKHLFSFMLWGPPGSGKTTLARIYANALDAEFHEISAVDSGKEDIKNIVGKRGAMQFGKPKILFIDEIHRFNKAQQDSFLPFVEDGTITLVGATTENPSFELNGALLSRAQVLVLQRLDVVALEQLLERAAMFEKRLLPLTAEARAALLDMADGDGRYFLNLVEEIFAAVPDDAEPIGPEALGKVLSKRLPLYDKAADGHYNLISALHKSVRGSDPNAALYYLARMLAAGEDPLFLARRIVRMAVEDVGLADPQAVTQALAAKDVYNFLGSPEGELALAQAVVYVATAPKSNAITTAFGAAMTAAKNSGSVAPPKIILNAPTKLMKQQEYGAGYRYDHDQPDAFSGQNYFPDEMGRQKFYVPVERGFEREIQKRLEYWDKLRRDRQKKPDQE